LLKKELGRQHTQQLLKQELDWNSLDRCQDGFWLDKYTLIIADKLQIVKVDRQLLQGERKKGPVPMLILNCVVEMMVDKNKKIISVETKEKLGLWLDNLSKIIKNKDLKSN
jgi:hypothetical protein